MEQKRKSVGRSSWINFLKRKVLPITVKREESGSRKERILYKRYQRKEIGRQSNSQENEKCGKIQAHKRKEGV